MAFFALTITGVAVADSRVEHVSSGWSDNTRWAVDISTRFSRDLRQNHHSSQQVVGFDLHKVFTGEQGDFATLVFQPYWVRLHDVQNPGFYFDGGDDAELTWRIANINYTGLSYGSFNVRAGHFEVPFGLEQNIDTNGTLRQYSFRDRGIKADWGVSVNGVLSEFDYEVALTRGSGNNISERDEPRCLHLRLRLEAHARVILSGVGGLAVNISLVQFANAARPRVGSAGHILQSGVRLWLVGEASVRRVSLRFALKGTRRRFNAMAGSLDLGLERRE